MTELNKGLGVEDTALAKFIEETMAKYFKEADEKSEARNSRLEKRIESMHNTLSRHTEEIKTLRTDITNLQQRAVQAEKGQKFLADKVVEMEDRARRDNVLIFNLKEGIEGSSTLAYLGENIPMWFPALEAAPELMRAHRLGPPRRGQASPTDAGPGKDYNPRPIILKCLRYTERDLLLKEARKKAPEVAGIQLKFAADYSEVTTKRRKPCYKIMHAARTRGFNAFLLYPATIKLQRGGETHTFKDPTEAELNKGKREFS
ncbi:hypothetical protein WMY93_002201 [Mugilogobius chulae]|uniref:L1 transposable element RRM domain-containing protein n=1 Tax=Mugilogobius chulae TaxID=88201 RepID=A0AAW0PTQ1_9GOBI